MIAAAVAATVAPATAAAAVGIADREADPVVLTGADVPELIGVDPGDLVGFRYDGGWKQIPVQVDERAVISYGAVRKTNGSFTHEAYTDPGTYAGADPDPTVDGDDEIAMMARDAGSNASKLTSPQGVVPATRTRVSVDDPIGDGPARFIYLFETDSGLDPAAGKSYVDYDYSLVSGDYKETYNFAGIATNVTVGPPANPEDSTVTTPFYSLHLLGAWVEDGMAIDAGAATGVDILDGDKAQVSFGCGRSEVSFSRGGGGFIANKSGPVRAIRSYIGANSGTYTQQDRVYYERAEVMRTYLRVHAGINTIDQFLDYSPAASGMTYRTSTHPGGVTIDGVPDPDLETGNALGPAVDWEQTTGPQGSLSIVSRVDTDIPTFAAGSYYQDDTTPTTQQCSGYADAEAWGAAGPGVTGVGVNTDPTLGPAKNLTATRTTFFSAPGATADLAALRSEQIDDPLAVSASAEPDPAALLLEPGKSKKVKPGKRVKLTLELANEGGSKATGIEACAKVPRHDGKGACKDVRDLGAGRSADVKLTVKTRKRAKRAIDVTFKVTADNARTAKAQGEIKVKK